MTKSKVPDLALLQNATRYYRERNYADVVRLIEPIGINKVRQNLPLGQLLCGSYYRLGNWDAALMVVGLLSAVCRRNGNVRLRRLVLNTEAAIYLERGQIDRSAALFKQLAALAHADRDNLLLAWANNNLGVIADVHCDWSTALADFQRAIAAYITLDEMRAIAAAHNNVCNCYLQLGINKAAIKNSEKARLLGRSYASYDEQSLFLSTYAEILIAVGDYRMARSIALKGYTLAQDINHPGRLVGAIRVLARTEARCGRHAVSQKLIRKAKDMCASLRSTLLDAELLLAEAEINFLSGLESEARESASRAEELWITIGVPARARWVQSVIENKFDYGEIGTSPPEFSKA